MEIKGLKKVVGNDDIKKLIIEDIILLEHNFLRTRGRILASPSGWGKTYLIEALEEEIDKDKFNVIKITDQFDGSYNEVSTIIKEFFNKCENNSKINILDIQECETLFMSRADKGSGIGYTSRKTTRAFLDGLSSYKPINLYILASTNRPGYIDSGFVSNIRRFEGIYYMKDYTLDNWKSLTEMYLQTLNVNEKTFLSNKIYELNSLETNYSKKWTPGDIKNLNTTIEANKILEKVTGIERTFNLVEEFNKTNFKKASINDRHDFVLGVNEQKSEEINKQPINKSNLNPVSKEIDRLKKGNIEIKSNEQSIEKPKRILKKIIRKPIEKKVD